jgi:hypothetical protein
MFTFGAILALIFVPNIDIFPRKTDGMLPKPDEMYQSNNSRESDDQGDRSHHAIICFQDLHFIKGEKCNCPFPGDYSKWLVGGIEQENPFHNSARRIAR